jgi:hypothetical protein
MVPFETNSLSLLNKRLSQLNGCPHVVDCDLKAIPYEEVTRALENYGRGQDWRTYKNDLGYTHLEELLMYQPLNWKMRVRGYILQYNFDLNQEHKTKDRAHAFTLIVNYDKVHYVVQMTSPILVVLFHPALTRTMRYDALRLLVSYGAESPLADLMAQTETMATGSGQALIKTLFLLDYLFAMKESLRSRIGDRYTHALKRYRLNKTYFVDEIKCCEILGQRMAKEIIRRKLSQHLVYAGHEEPLRPLILLFTGPSGTGKTEMAIQLADILNVQKDENFIKINCGTMSDETEVFGSLDYRQGRCHGSVLNNFMIKMSKKPQERGIVLLDDIHNATEEVIELFCKVFQTGHWANTKQPISRWRQSDALCSCSNVVFIATTNVADKEIVELCMTYNIHSCSYSDLVLTIEKIERQVHYILRDTNPFSDRFMKCIGNIVIFSPFSTISASNESNSLLKEAFTIVQLLIEKEQEDIFSMYYDVEACMSTETKELVARTIVNEWIPETGVRGLKRSVEDAMRNKILHSLLLRKDGISRASTVWYQVGDDQTIDFFNGYFFVTVKTLGFIIAGVITACLVKWFIVMYQMFSVYGVIFCASGVFIAYKGSTDTKL